MLKAKEYHYFSNEVYKKKKYNYGDYLEDSKTKYKILSVGNNQDNGMKAMAVAPVDSNGEVEI